MLDSHTYTVSFSPGLGFSWAKAYLGCISAVILELEFLPVRSEGSFSVLPSLGDLA